MNEPPAPSGYPGAEPTPAGAAGPQPTPPGYGPHPHGPPPPAKRRIPVWAIVLIVVGALTVVAVIVVLVSGAIAIPMFLNQRDEAKDRSVKEGVHSIQVGIQSYAVDNNDVYPDPSEVSRDGEVGQVMDMWPTNPFTNQPMELGTAEGDFQYEVLSDGSDYSLKGNLSGGHDFVLR